MAAALLLAACGDDTTSVDALQPHDGGARADAASPVDASAALFDLAIVNDLAQTAVPDTAQSLTVDAAVDGAVTIPPGATWRSSLSVCWTDPTCKRALAVSHGGDWSALGNPYDSNAALAAAYANGSDGVKVDVRVTADNIPVIAHSSPIQLYESIDCANKKIEEMTAAQVTACHRFPSTTETFQRLDTVLSYLKGKLTAELTVKLSTDYARTIQEVLADGAADFAYLEISVSDLQTLIPKITGSDRVYYLINVASTPSDIDVLIPLKNPRAFMVEIDPTVTVGTLITGKLHPAGLRAFSYDSPSTVTESDLKGLYDAGYDVVSSNTTGNGVAARMMVNQARGITPP